MMGWIRSARVLALVVVAGLLTTGCIDFAVTKRTRGQAPPGPFVVKIECEVKHDGLPIDGGGGGAGSSETATPAATTNETRELTFSGEGTQKTDQITFPDGGECIITEPETAGATSVDFSCESIQPSNLKIKCENIPNGLKVTIPDDLAPGDEATVNLAVTNHFPEPTPTTQPPITAAAPTTTAAAPATEAAPAVTARPTFTG